MSIRHFNTPQFHTADEEMLSGPGIKICTWSPCYHGGWWVTMGDDRIISAVVDGLIASPWLRIHSAVASLCAIKKTPTGPCDRVNAYELL